MLGALGWDGWLKRMFPQYFPAPFAEHHGHFWRWAWGIVPNERPKPYLGIWHRKGAKSTNAEAFVVMLGCEMKRRYGLYVSTTQKQADDHVDTIGTMLGHLTVQQYYPAMSERSVNQWGNLRSWTRRRLWTSSGFVVEGFGLDTAIRGVKLEERRPDFIVIDDVDRETDSPYLTQKKLDRLQRSILPAGSNDCAILMMQNLVLENGVFGRLAGVGRSRAEFLYDREFFGLVPAIQDLEIAQNMHGDPEIVGGRPVWQGFDMEQAKRELSDFGLNAFLAEFQHQVRAKGQHFLEPEDVALERCYDPYDLTIPQRMVRRLISWDTGEEEHDGAAWSAAVVLDIVERRGGMRRYEVLIRHARRVRMVTTDLEDEVIRYAQEWHSTLLKEVWVEYASSGKAVVHGVRRRGPRWLAAAMREAKPRASKDARSATMASYVREQAVRLPKPTAANAEWRETLLQEMLEIPLSTYRDLTDALSHGVRASLAYLNSMR
jgi:phage terminase large subunit-like protein